MGPADVATRILGQYPTAVRQLPPTDAEFRVPVAEIHQALLKSLRKEGITQLFSHQSQAFDLASQNKDFIVATGTSSGKSLCYNLPVIDTCLREAAARALYLFPTKALAQDQASKLQTLLPEGLRCGTYDGDTSSSERSSIRKAAHIVLTNPDMLHVGILPNQENWHKFFKALRFIVIDEAHVYRGVFGSHVSNVIRRLLRLCAWQKNYPQVIACSATCSNPGEHFELLTSRKSEVITTDTAPKSHRNIILVEPPDGVENHSTNVDTASLLAEFVANGVRTLAFCRSRMTVEQVLQIARQSLDKLGIDSKLIDAYRGGYTAKERRQIEKDIFSGRLLGLVSTNAMELGVDIGGLDAVILNGYPGSVSSFWQQVGRAGRGTRDGLSVMLAHADPLERFLVHVPEMLLDKPVEAITLNPYNPNILIPQLRCAAHERPMTSEELDGFGIPFGQDAATEMVESGDATWQSGLLYYPSYENPAKKVNIRGSSSRQIMLIENGQLLGDMEYWRGLAFAHKGAIYLHRGETYLVTDLDLVKNEAQLEPFDGNFFTAPQIQDLVETTAQISEPGSMNLVGVRVTTTIPSYSKFQNPGRTLIEEIPLDLPPQTFESIAVRFNFPDIPLEMSPIIHALEHALLSVAPLLAGCDKTDVGSCWFIMSPDSLEPSIYIYDKTPGGVGIAEELFKKSQNWFRSALDLLQSCSCIDGCPGCLWITTCTNNNLDKQGAIGVLSRIVEASIPVSSNP